MSTKKVSYLMRDLDPMLWQEFRTRTATELRPMKAVILRLIELYNRHGLSAIEQALHMRKVS